MKVLVVHNRYVSASPSGENVVVDQEIDLLRQAGVAVVPYLRSSDEIAGLPASEKALLPVAPTYAPHAVREVRRALAREQPDVLHLHNPYPLISPWVIRTARAAGVPVVQTVHNYRHVCAKGIYFRDGHDCRDCLGKAVPWPAVAHSCYRDSRAQSVAIATALTVHRGTWPFVDRYLALTPALADHLRSTGITDEHITVKPNSVPDPGRHDSSGDGFLLVGRLTEDKGVTLLLDAWRAEPDGALGILHVAGDGPLRGAVENCAAARGDVVYHGRVDSAGVRDLMRRTAATVVPSRWDEICPMVVIEALANARPVLATAKGGLPYLVTSEVGWTVPDTVEALRAALRTAREQAPHLAAAARKRYETHFTPDVVTGQLLDVYRSVAPSATAPAP